MSITTTILINILFFALNLAITLGILYLKKSLETSIETKFNKELETHKKKLERQALNLVKIEEVWNAYYEYHQAALFLANDLLADNAKKQHRKYKEDYKKKKKILGEQKEKRIVYMTSGLYNDITEIYEKFIDMLELQHTKLNPTDIKKTHSKIIEGFRELLTWI